MTWRSLDPKKHYAMLGLLPRRQPHLHKLLAVSFTPLPEAVEKAHKLITAYEKAQKSEVG